MKIEVTDAGVIIPRDMLPDVDEVDVRVEGDIVLLTPSRDDNLIWEMGSKPVTCGLADASTNHDRYLYQGDT